MQNHRSMVGTLRCIEDAVWEVLSPREDAMEVALRPAGRDVPPVLLLVDLPQLGKPIEDTHLCH